MKKLNYIALLPIGVFLVLYLGLGILFEYVMKIPMGFDNVPIVVAFLAAILTACLQNPKLHFDQKLEIMAQGVGDKNIITMLLIFLFSRIFRRNCRKKQCRKCCLLYAVIDSGALFSSCFICSSLFCISCHGNISRYNYASCSNCSGCL